MNKFLKPYPVENLIAESQSELDAIKTAAGFKDAHFEHFFMPVVKALGRYVQMLPLSMKAYHEERGAWNFGMTASMVALRYAETQLFFPGLESEERRRLEPQCRFMAFAAVMSSVVAMLAQNTVITSGSKDYEQSYHPLVTPMPLSTWLEKYPDTKFAWQTDGEVLSAPECAAIASRFIPNGLLADFDIRASLMLFGAIAPHATSNGLESTLSKVVRMSITKVIEHYLAQDAARYQSKDSPAQMPAKDGQSIANSLIAMAVPKDRVNPLDPSYVAPNAASQPTGAVARSGEGGPSLETLMANSSPVLRDWFNALQKHERYPDLKKNLQRTERGTEIPTSMLGLFGVNAPTIKKLMMDAGMVVDRSADQRALILQPSLDTLLFTE